MPTDYKSIVHIIQVSVALQKQANLTHILLQVVPHALANCF